MATGYKLTIHIHKTWIESWTDPRPRLCIGHSIYEKRRYVITRVLDVQDKVDSEWKEDLHVAAVDDGFRAGEVITVPNEEWTSIGLANIALIEKNQGKWACSIENETKGPHDGIGFRNKLDPASCVLGREFDGSVKPVYVSPVLLPPSGKGWESVIPDANIVLWFERDVSEGQLIDTAEQAPLQPQATKPSGTDKKPPPDLRTKFRFPITSYSPEVWYDQHGYWQTWDPALTES